MPSLCCMFLTLTLTTGWAAGHVPDSYWTDDNPGIKAVDAVSKEILTRTKLDKKTKLVLVKFASAAGEGESLSYSYLITVATEPRKLNVDVIINHDGDGVYKLVGVGKVFTEKERPTNTSKFFENFERSAFIV